jgi:hypothetical protein
LPAVVRRCTWIHSPARTAASCPIWCSNGSRA